MKFGTLNQMMRLPEDGMGNQAGGASGTEGQTETEKLIAIAVTKAVGIAITENNVTWAEKLSSEVAGLKKSRDTILTEKKDLEARNRTEEQERLSTGGDTVKLRESIQAEFQEKLNAQEEKFKTLQSEFDNQRNTVQSKTISGSLDGHLSQLNVLDSLRPALKSLFGTKHKIECGKEFDCITIDGQSSQDFFDTWSKTDEAKGFIKAPDLQGGGAPGNGTSSSGMALSGDIDGFSKALNS